MHRPIKVNLYSFGGVKKTWATIFIIVLFCSFVIKPGSTRYYELYDSSLHELVQKQMALLEHIKAAPKLGEAEKKQLELLLAQARMSLKKADFWLRYLEPVAYKKINGPLPVEWENEVFEKYEKPYKREGAGLSLAELYLEGTQPDKDSLTQLIKTSIETLNTFLADSITGQLNKPDHFFLCNRLYLLNLAAIYTTGFECPHTGNIIPELRTMLAAVRKIYDAYNGSFPGSTLGKEYLALYDKMGSFVNGQPASFAAFDHFSFIKDYVNPLFALNQSYIQQYHVVSQSFNDYSLSNECGSIFDKSLYRAQNSKGIYALVDDPKTLSEIKAVGKLLFYDPIISGNDERACASCHKPTEYFTDTSVATAPGFGQNGRLPRNTPSLINVVYNHLLMLDGKHISLHAQATDVMTNANEMSGGEENDIVKKVLSCKEYNKVFKKLLKSTPEAKEITLEHITSAITYYYGSFSLFYSPFDNAMNNGMALEPEAIKGFNLFMSKAQCGTCHFVPQFNGVAPPYVSSEFEVLGVPADSNYHKLSEDKGRYTLNPAPEMLDAFRTNTLRNVLHTKPYMHNGVFTNLDQVLNFYNDGGGAGKKLPVANQTLSADSLKLSNTEKKELTAFIRSLSENITFDKAPEELPRSSIKELNTRKPGGIY
jgi:cytochrome c peroxidase